MPGDLRPGDPVTWVRVPRGGYGFAVHIPATVVRVGKRVTIAAQLRDGGARTVTVQRQNLRQVTIGKGET